MPRPREQFIQCGYCRRWINPKLAGVPEASRDKLRIGTKEHPLAPGEGTKAHMCEHCATTKG